MVNVSFKYSIIGVLETYLIVLKVKSLNSNNSSIIREVLNVVHLHFCTVNVGKSYYQTNERNWFYYNYIIRDSLDE